MYKDGLVYILNPAVAKELLLRGFSILDIEPHPQNSDATVFYFKGSEDLKAILRRDYEYEIY